MKYEYDCLEYTGFRGDLMSKLDDLGESGWCIFSIQEVFISNECRFEGVCKVMVYMRRVVVRESKIENMTMKEEIQYIRNTLSHFKKSLGDLHISDPDTNLMCNNSRLILDRIENLLSDRSI